MNTIHPGNKGEIGITCCGEIGSKDYEQKVCEELAEEVTKMLDINWADRAIFTKILTVNFARIMKGHDGLLEQYLHTQLDIIAEAQNINLNLNQLSHSLKERDEKVVDGKTGNVKVNYGHATHAKLNSIIEAILLKGKLENQDLKRENTRLKSEIDKLKDHIHSGFGGNS